MSGWRSVVLSLMRVPSRPSPPPGSRPRVFRAARSYFTLRAIGWLLVNLALLTMAATLIALVTLFLPAGAPGPARAVAGFSAAAVVVILLVRLTLGYAVMRLDYELRWYMISDRAIRIREGILNVREKTIALANVQNTVVRQGPLQRLLGIADVEVRTAGGGASDAAKGKGESVGEPMHIGYLRGVANASELRSIILEGVRRHRNTGIGDPEDSIAKTDSAHLLLSEARQLRETLEALTR